MLNTRNECFEEISRELDSALLKFPDVQSEAVTALCITEETGELCQAILSEKETRYKDAEAIQVAAMAIRFLLRR